MAWYLLVTLALSDVVPLEHEGRPGVWIVESEARRLHEVDLELDLRREQVDELTRQIEALESAAATKPETTPWWVYTLATVGGVLVGAAVGVIFE